VHDDIEFQFIIRNHLRVSHAYAKLASHARALTRVSSFDHIRCHLNRRRRSRNRADSNEIRLSRALIPPELIVSLLRRYRELLDVAQHQDAARMLAREIYEVRVTIRANYGVELSTSLSRKDILDSRGYVCAYEHAIRFDDDRFRVSDFRFRLLRVAFNEPSSENIGPTCASACPNATCKRK